MLVMMLIHHYQHMAQAIPIAPQPLDNVMVEAIDFLHIAKFFWTTEDNFSRFETTAIEQIRKTFFTFVRQQGLDALPGTPAV